MLVRHHMTREIHRFAPQDDAAEALATMREGCFRFAPVLEGEKLVGVVTERDLLRILPGTIRAHEEQPANETLRVVHAMSAKVLTVGPNEHVEDAAQVLFDQRINGLPVVDAGTLLGVLTTSDILHSLFQNAAASEGERITILLATLSGGPDLWETCRAHGMTLNTVWRHRARGGATLVTLRVIGPEERLADLCEALSKGGAIVVDGERRRRKAG